MILPLGFDHIFVFMSEGVVCAPWRGLDFVQPPFMLQLMLLDHVELTNGGSVYHINIILTLPQR